MKSRESTWRTEGKVSHHSKCRLANYRSYWHLLDWSERRQEDGSRGVTLHLFEYRDELRIVLQSNDPQTVTGRPSASIHDLMLIFDSISR